MHALLLAAWAKWDDAVAECDALAARNERLQHLLRKLQRMQFGRRSEQLTADQLQSLSQKSRPRSPIPQRPFPTHSVTESDPR
ncbi:transposase [Paeniroseomonas aquatica]|uniref:transposase n=1 Tax=Paeniroseomonas aquatica TaxID=373043 RepID=UPI00361EBECB